MNTNMYTNEKKEYNYEFDLEVVTQCAPLLQGIKIANLLIVRLFDKENVIALFKKTRFSCLVLYEETEKVIFLVYLKDSLKLYLERKEVSKLMNKFGYYEKKLELILHHFALNYAKYRNHIINFPHEMGLILGYPAEDVKGFVENEGKNYLHLGYWKVYGDVENTTLLFQNFDAARELLVSYVKSGIQMKEIVKNASKNQNIYDCVNENANVYERGYMQIAI